MLKSYKDIKPQMKFYLDIEELYPTQPDLGFKEIDYKVQIISKMGEKELDKYLIKKVSPVIIGPKGKIYIIDHHHHAYSLMKSGKGLIYVVVVENWSNLSEKDFWAKMIKNKFVLLKKQGKSISVKSLPSKISQMGNEDYRSLAWSVRELNGFNKVDHIPFFEFAWGDFYRQYISPNLIRDHYSLAVKVALEISKSKLAKKLPGYKR